MRFPPESVGSRFDGGKFHIDLFCEKKIGMERVKCILVVPCSLCPLPTFFGLTRPNRPIPSHPPTHPPTDPPTHSPTHITQSVASLSPRHATKSTERPTGDFDVATLATLTLDRADPCTGDLDLAIVLHATYRVMC